MRFPFENYIGINTHMTESDLAMIKEERKNLFDFLQNMHKKGNMNFRCIKTTIQRPKNHVVHEFEDFLIPSNFVSVSEKTFLFLKVNDKINQFRLVDRGIFPRYWYNSLVDKTYESIVKQRMEEMHDLKFNYEKFVTFNPETDFPFMKKAIDEMVKKDIGQPSTSISN